VNQSERIFRKLCPGDVEMVVRMETDFRSGFVCRENAERFLENPGNWLFACVENRRILGFAYGYELNQLNNIGNMLYIHEVGVLPEFQRQGIGKGILNGIRDLCKLTGVCRFFLFAEKSNTAACALYEQAGGVTAHDDDVAYFFSNL